MALRNNNVQTKLSQAPTKTMNTTMTLALQTTSNLVGTDIVKASTGLEGVRRTVIKLFLDFAWGVGVAVEKKVLRSSWYKQTPTHASSPRFHRTRLR